MGLATSPNGLRYPVRADTPDPPRDIQRLAEDTELTNSLYSGMPYFGKPYIFSGGSIGNPGGLFASVGSGVAMINGWRIPFAAPANLALAASTTNHIWLKATMASGRATGAVTWVVKQTQALEADAVYVGQVVTGGAAQSTRSDSYRGLLVPGMKLTSFVPTAATVTGNDAGSIVIVGDGVTSLMVDGSIAASPNTANPTAVFCEIRDGAAGSGTRYALGYGNWPSSFSGVGGSMPMGSVADIPPWVGTKQFWCWFNTIAQPATIAGGSRAIFRVV